MLSIDIGHLITADSSSHLITLNEFDKFVGKYGQVAQEFQLSIKENRSPLTLSLKERDVIPRIKELAKKLRDKYDNFLVLGIGGSALGTKAVLQFLKGNYYVLEKEQPRIFVLDNLDPLLVSQIENIIDLKKTALIYTSRSGSTPETAANFLYFFKKCKDAGGDVRDIVVICNPGNNGINNIAKELGCHLLHIPPDMQGRYSVLSSVGFLPSEIAGIDSNSLLDGAFAVNDSLIRGSLVENPVLALGTCLFELAMKGKSVHVLFNYTSRLFEFGLWFMQLWAESLGKKVNLEGKVIHAGTTPLACVGATDQHSLLQLFKEGPADKVFGFIKIKNFPVDFVLPGEFASQKEYSYLGGHTLGEQLNIEQLSTEVSLASTGHPCYSLTLNEVSPQALGALFYFYEALVVYVAGLWRVNPFDQPGVEEGKNITYSLMGREDYSSMRPGYEQKVEQYNRGSKIYDI